MIVAGVGWSAAEFAALDQPFTNRGRRMDEALDILRNVWEHDPASHDGEHYAFTDVRVLPQPAHRIPIWIGGSSRAAIARATRVGDGYQAISTPPTDVAKVVAPMRIERPGDDFTISYRTGWDPQGMDPGLIREERAAYADAGVQHVVSAPWRTDADSWIRSMELLVDIVQPDVA